MKCLSCGNEMTSNQVVTHKASVTYDMCEECGSLWLDAGELDKLAFQVEGDIEYCSQEKDAKQDAKPLKCPRCDDSDLDRVKFIGTDETILHRCGNCGGFWLDAGQLNLLDKELARIMPVSGKGFSDFVNNVHVPYWFKRIQKKSGDTDFHIEVAPIKGAEVKAGTTDLCPACGAALNLYKVFSMQFEGCPKCKGIWLVEDELRRLKNKMEPASLRWLNEEIDNIEKTSARTTNRLCPKCKTSKMVAAVFGHSSIVIDWCPRCRGTWLDRREFEFVVDYLKDELGHATPQEMEKIAVQDLKEVWTGGPESRLAELHDAAAALHALINFTIMDNPALQRTCLNAAALFP